MNDIARIPELVALDRRDSLIRLPGEEDVPVTPRIRRLIDAPPFRRLAHISQLGLVQLVYPGATHSRFEHSLGVYRNALLFIRRLAAAPELADLLSSRDVEALIVTALLHDIGHWPYCHPIEDMGLEQIPSHESLAARRLDDPSIAEIIDSDFECSAADVAVLLNGQASAPADRLRQSILSGPIDVDKMDYLVRDSLHAGVPYGMNFDKSRLVGSLCIDERSGGLAITGKGCTAAEMMVFARYVMFSEVYWHHAVRAATAMLQRAMYEMRDQIDIARLVQTDDAGFTRIVRGMARESACGELIEGLFGSRRVLYKRFAQFSILEDQEVFDRFSRRPYCELVECARLLSERLNAVTGDEIGAADVLIDAPPPGLEIQFRVPVRYDSPRRYRWLEEVSPVVKTLATRQFDNYVKQVRVYVHPARASTVRKRGNFRDLLLEVTPQSP